MTLGLSTLDLVDTHCHPQFDDFLPNPDRAIEAASAVGVTRLVAVGTTLADSQKAIDFAVARPNVWASAGVHPHAAGEFLADAKNLDELSKILNKLSIVAVGEMGLDYYKNYSSKEAQISLLRAQLDAAKGLDLPFIFHVRDSWEDFWAVFDEYDGLRGVIHSFSSGPKQLAKALERGLYVGLNGIMTFTKDESQLAAARAVPLERLLLETDAPFLTPAPFRGELCQPKHTRIIAEFLAELRNEPLAQLAAATSDNAVKLFRLDEASSG